MKQCKGLERLLRDSAGATAVEYGLILALIVFAIMTSVQFTAAQTAALWEKVKVAVDAVMS